MRVPHPTVIHIEHLPAPSRRRFQQVLARKGRIVPTVAVASRATAWAALAAVAAIVAAGALAAAIDAGGASLVLAGVAVAAAAILVVVAAVRWRRLARCPFPPGRYVIGAFVVDATTPLLRVDPIARTRPAVVRRRGGYWLVFDADQHRHRLPIAGDDQLRLAMACIHGDMVAYAGALAAGDRVTAGALDPLAEARDLDGAVVGATQTVASRRPGARRMLWLPPSPSCPPALRPPPTSDKSLPSSPM